jgi:hypothetical protein
MSQPDSPERHQARAIIIAAAIGVVGSIAAAYLGREAGQRDARDDTRRLEARFEEVQRETRNKDEQLAQAVREIGELRQTLSQKSRVVVPTRLPQIDSSPDSESTVSTVAETPTPDPSQPLATAKEQGFQFDMMGCQDDGSSIRCDVVVTNQRPDRWIWISSGRDPGTYVVDAGGHTCTANDSSFTWGTLVEGVPIRATFDFQRCSADGTTLKYVQIGFKLGNPAFNSSFKVPFHDVPLGQ